VKDCRDFYSGIFVESHAFLFLLPQSPHACGFHDFGARFAKSRSTAPTA
jgi:hypothetical protein